MTSDLDTVTAEFSATIDRLVRERVMCRSGTTSLSRISAGASQETWMLAFDDGKTVEQLVLRRAPGGVASTSRFAVGLDTEVRLIRRAEDAGVPVPHVLYGLTPEDGLGQGFIMRFVPGETIARKILRDARFADVRPRLARRCGDVLAQIHSISTDGLTDLKVEYGADRLATLRRDYQAQDHPRPVFELAFQWLADNLPAQPTQPKLVHGDFRNGNLMIDDSGIGAVLDWELAHLGDPLEDLGWLCVPSWRFGEIDQEVGGFGPLDDLIAGYQAMSGRAVDRDAIKFWTVLGTLFWGLSCVNFALQFRRGDRTVERAAIGRRASETEIDLLMQIDRRV